MAVVTLNLRPMVNASKIRPILVYDSVTNEPMIVKYDKHSTAGNMWKVTNCNSWFSSKTLLGWLDIPVIQ